MRIEGPAVRATIFVDGNDLWHHRPLYSEIVHRAHKHGLAGATVLRGIDGFSATSAIHRERFFGVAEHLPITIVIVDSRQQIAAFLESLDGMLAKGVVVLDEVEVLRYLPDPPSERRSWT
jgi:PII-like signaling protein